MAKASTLGQTNYHPYPAPHNSPQEIDLSKLARLKLGNVYIKEIDTYSVFGAIIASCFTKEEELRMMPPIIKFKPFAWEYEPMKHIRWTTEPRVIKEIEANTNLKEALTQGLKYLLKCKMISLRNDQLELAEELGLASI